MMPIGGRNRFFAALFGFLLFTAVAGNADIIIVEPGGAYSTIQSALDAAEAGDVIQVKNGVYNEKIVFPKSGSPNNYITLEAYEGHSPIIDGTGLAAGDMALIPSRSYVKISGFVIRNNLNVSDASGIRVTGAGAFIEIRNNRIHEIRGEHAMGITVYGTAATPISNLIIDSNEIYDCDPADSEALTLNGNVTDFEVTNNIVRDVNNIGIDFIGGETDIQPDPALVARNGVCRGNQVYRANHADGYAGGIYVDGGKDIIIENNIVSDCDLGIEIGAENAGLVTSGVTVRNNRIYKNQKAGLVFGGYDASVGRTKDCKFLNNVLFKNDVLNEGVGEVWIQYAENNILRNNIFFSNAQNILLYSEAGNINNTLNYNQWYTAAGAGSAEFTWSGVFYGSFAAYRNGSGQDANSQFGNPLFANAAAADFHVAANSPVINKGDPAFVPGAGEVDIDDQPRLSGGRVDIGADEIQQTAMPPAAPSNLVASAGGSSTINLSWVDNANNETGFKIERKTGTGGAYAEITQVGANVTSYPNTALPPGTYYYRVRAYNADGNSAYSNEANATVPPGTANLALNKPASASSTNGSNTPSKAVDGNTTTFWRSGSLGSTTKAWLLVDLQSVQNIGRVVIKWRGIYYAQRYQIEISTDGVNFTTVYTDNAGNGGTDDITFPAVAARYVELWIKRNNSSSERVNEFEVYAGASALAKEQSAEDATSVVPDEITLAPNYPNPFNPTTQIAYSVPNTSHVTLKIYNLIGGEVATLVNEMRERGNYTVTFDASQLTSGIYFSVLQAGDVRRVRRLVYVK